MVSKYEYKLERVTLNLLNRFQKLLDLITLGVYYVRKLDKTGIMLTILVVCWFLFMINFDKIPFNT